MCGENYNINIFSVYNWTETEIIHVGSRKRSLKRPAALKDYVTEDKDSFTRYGHDDSYNDDENEDHLVEKVEKAYKNLKRIQKVRYKAIE